MNNYKLYVLFAVLALLLIMPGAVLVGIYGTAFGMAFALVILVLLNYRSDLLIMEKFGGREITDKSFWVYGLVERVAKRAGLGSVPGVYLIPVKTPNSFVVGRNPRRAKLGLTEGLLETLSERELEGVVGHELAHIRACNAKLSGIVTVIANTLLRLAPEGAFQLKYGSFSKFDGAPDDRSGVLHSLQSLLVTPVAAAFVQLAISRNREFTADRQGAAFTNRFKELATALQKIQSSSDRIFSDNHPHLAHLLIHSDFRSPLLSFLFSAHPPVSERVAQLERLASTGGGVEGVY